MKRMEEGKVASAGQSEFRWGAVDFELIGEDLRAGPSARGCAHALILRGRRSPPEVLEFRAVGNPLVGKSATRPGAASPRPGATGRDRRRARPSASARR